MSTTELAFPPIDAEAMAVAAKTATSIATTEAQPVDLAKLDLTAVALADPDEKPTIKLGDINDWLKRLSVSAEQLEALGFTAHVDRNARLYKPSDKARIREALIQHLQGLH